MELIFLTLIPIPILAWLWFELIRDEAPPIPLSKKTVREILKLAQVTHKDTVYDLGSGDGRVLLISSKELNARSVGIEKNRFFVWLSRRMIRMNKLQDKAKIMHGDIFGQKLDGADVIVMYLSHKLSQRLKNKFENELRKGTRIVSASHPIVGWKEVEKLRTGHFYSYLYKFNK